MSIRPRNRLWGCLVLLLLANACTPLATSNPPEDGNEEPASESDRSDQSDKSDRSDDAGLEQLVGQATADLGERLSIGEDAVEVTRAERVTWRDSSLGCPEPGMMYMQALQPGVLIELRAGGKSYRYHSTPDGPSRYCEKPSKKDPLPADEASQNGR